MMKLSKTKLCLLNVFVLNYNMGIFTKLLIKLILILRRMNLSKHVLILNITVIDFVI